MKKWLLRHLVPTLASLIIRTLVATLRYEIHDPHGALRGQGARPVIFCFWHNRLLLMPSFYNRFFPGRTGTALISRSRDGEVISAITAKFGVLSVRGSSSQQAAVAFRELVRRMEKGHDVSITPDGPRGPRYHVHPGVLQLSQMTGSPILPASYELSRKWEMKSWDRFQIPKPFSTCRLYVSEMFVVPPGAEDLRPYTERLNRVMGGDQISRAE